MDNETITQDSQLESSEYEAVSEADNAEEAKSETSSDEEKSSSLTLDELNAILGKSFKTKESALKSLRETNAYVGKRKQEIENELKDTSNKEMDKLTKKLNTLEKENFYSKNPQYKEFEGLIEKLSLDADRTKAVESEEFKSIFSKIAAKDESQPQRSVLHSNPEISDNSTEYEKQFQKAQKTGDWTEVLKKKGIVLINE